MKRFYYIDKNEQEQLDLIALFEFVLDYRLSYDEVVIALSELNKYINIKTKKNETT